MATQDGSGVAEECLSLVRAGSAILGDAYVGGGGTLQLSIMGVLPFIVGLLGGLPVVARELEERTAHTAWWLDASRTRWLARQILPIGLLLGTVVVLAAAAATPVADDWVRWGHGGASDLIGQHGPLAVVRAFAAFGMGLGVGALLGRTTPAWIFSIALLIAILLALGQAREAWISRLPLEIIATYSDATERWTVIPGAEARSWGWIAPGGRFVNRQEARQLATEAGVPPANPDDLQDTPAAIWLGEHGSAEVPLGVTDEMAMGWAPYDGLAFGVVGCVTVAGTFILINRRRPT